MIELYTIPDLDELYSVYVGSPRSTRMASGRSCGKHYSLHALFGFNDFVITYGPAVEISDRFSSSIISIIVFILPPRFESFVKG